MGSQRPAAALRVQGDDGNEIRKQGETFPDHKVEGKREKRRGSVLKVVKGGGDIFGDHGSPSPAFKRLLKYDFFLMN